MEASEAQLEPGGEIDEPGEGETADGTEVQRGDTGLDVETSTEAHEPAGAEDQHGTTTPSSAAPPESLAGGVTPDPVENPPGTMTGA